MATGFIKSDYDLILNPKPNSANQMPVKLEMRGKV